MKYALKLGGDYGADKDKKSGKIIKRYKIYIKNYYQKFKNVYEFMKNLLNQGMKKGIYKIKVGNDSYILKFYKDFNYEYEINMKINQLVRSKERDIWYIVGLQKKYNYKVIAINANEEVISKFIKKYPSIKLLKPFKNGYDFKEYLKKHKNQINKGVYKVEVGSLYAILEFK